MDTVSMIRVVAGVICVILIFVLIQRRRKKVK